MKLKPQYQTIALAVLVLGAMYLGYMEIKRVHKKMQQLESVVRGVRVYQQTHSKHQVLNEQNNQLPVNVAQSVVNNNVSDNRTEDRNILDNTNPSTLHTQQQQVNTQILNQEQNDKCSLETLMEEYNRNLEGQDQESEDSSSYYTEETTDDEDEVDRVDAVDRVIGDRNLDNEHYEVQTTVQLDDNLKRSIEKLSTETHESNNLQNTNATIDASQTTTQTSTKEHSPDSTDITQETPDSTDTTTSTHQHQHQNPSEPTTTETVTQNLKNQSENSQTQDTQDYKINLSLNTNRQFLFDNLKIDDALFKDRFRKYTCKDLRELLKSFDMSCSGSKNVLLDRLLKCKHNLNVPKQISSVVPDLDKSGITVSSVESSLEQELSM